MSLNESDFKRLELSTKIVKAVQKIQKSVLSEHIIEEYLVNAEDITSTDEHPEDLEHDEEPHEEHEPVDPNDVDHSENENPDAGINLEREGDVAEDPNITGRSDNQNPYIGISLERVRITFSYTVFSS